MYKRNRVLILLLPLLCLGAGRLEDPSEEEESGGKITVYSNSGRGLASTASSVMPQANFNKYPSYYSGDGSMQMPGRNPSSDYNVDKDAAKNDSAVTPEVAHRFGVQEISVIVTENGFIPSKIYVRNNIPVRIFAGGMGSN